MKKGTLSNMIYAPVFLKLNQRWFCNLCDLYIFQNHVLVEMALKDDSNHTKYSKSANSDFGCLSDQCAQSGGQHCSNHCFRPNQMYRYITTRSLPRLISNHNIHSYCSLMIQELQQVYTLRATVVLLLTYRQTIF